jgi:hypothetical protein
MSLRREGRSVACPVVVKQEQEVVDTKDRLLLDRDIEIVVPCQGPVNILNKH